MIAVRADKAPLGVVTARRMLRRDGRRFDTNPELPILTDGDGNFAEVMEVLHMLYRSSQSVPNLPHH